MVWTATLKSLWWMVRLGLLVSAGLLLISAVAELAASIFLPPPPADKSPLPITTHHPSLGYTLVPGQQSYTYGETVQTNSEGLREYELPTAELHNHVVILCLGGSETFGKGVAFEETYPKKLEKMLNASPAAQPVKVINAGVPDYNTLQQLRFLQERGRRYHPDVVIIGFYWDDLLPVSALEATGDRQAISREWALKAWARKYDLLEFIAPLYTRSRVLYLMRDGLKNLFGLLQGDIRQEWLTAILEGRHLQPLEEAWQRFEGYLEEF